MPRARQRAAFAFGFGFGFGLTIMVALADTAMTIGHEPVAAIEYRDSQFVPVTTADFPPAATVSPTDAPRPIPATPPPVVPTPVPTRPHAPTVAEAKAWAAAQIGPTQYACLADIVRHEDGTWDPYRLNRTSGAYGIPQALPGTKMASAGADWRWNRITQLRWMLTYVNARYGSACDAASYRTVHGWY